MTKPLEYMVLAEIKMGQAVGVNPALGGVVPASASGKTINIGVAKRDLRPGQIVKVVLHDETDDITNRGEVIR